jgi:O-antigen/teichoic acid export membrane protein
VNDLPTVRTPVAQLVAARAATLARRVFRLEAEGSLRQQLVGGTIATAAIKAAGLAFSFIIGVILARALGPKTFGVYAYALAWVNLLALPAAAGLHTIVIRDIAAYHATKRWGLMRGLLVWASRGILVFSFGMGSVAFVLATTLVAHRDPDVITTLWISLPLVCFAALTRLRQGALQGLRHVALGQVPENVVEPIVFLALLGIAAVVAHRLSAETAMLFNVAATLVGFLAGTWLLVQLLPADVKRAEPVYRQREWFVAALPLLALFAMNAFNQRIDTIILGALKGSEPVGIYTVASRGADLLSFIYLAAHAVVSPTISKLYAEGRLGRLQRMITRSIRWIFGISLPVGIALIIFGPWLLLIFGPGFVVARMALAILSAGRLANIALGWNLSALMMTGFQRDAAVSTGITVVLHVLLSFTLIPRWGLEGAAAAAALSLAFWNLLMTWQLRARTGLDSTILGLPRQRPDGIS